MARSAATTLLRPLVVALFALQVVSYVALLAVFSVHGETPGVVETIRALPTPVLVVLSIPALPAVIVSVAFAGVLSVGFGLSPFQLGTVFLTPGDALVYLAAYLVAVAVGVLADRVAAGREETA